MSNTVKIRSLANGTPVRVSETRGIVTTDYESVFNYVCRDGDSPYCVVGGYQLRNYEVKEALINGEWVKVW
jgi:hypothetical protein